MKRKNSKDKQMSKSELDEIQGIGEVKKKALLKEFGSVDKIKQATVEELMTVPGINESLAKKLIAKDI